MDQGEQRHSCRFCSKTFPCGRSLGGHMRSHMSSSSSTSFAEESKLGCGAAGNGYGLRENPKKTWRLSGDVDDEEEEKKCRECGKEFRSWRALFGHMRCHSSSHDKREVEEEVEEEDGSRSGGGAAAAADGEALVRVPKKKRRSRRPGAIVGSSSSASEEHEQEDVAISLMMLSRDAGYWGSSPDESSDKNSAILEEDRDWNESKKPNSYKDGEFYYDSESEEESKKGGSCVKKRKRRTRLDHVGVDCDEDGYGGRLGIESRYECSTCNKSFHSYQALGGHRASHKRLKGRGCCSGGGGESTTSQLDTDTCASVVDPIVVHSGKAKARNHQCGVCGKVFASGQALGGHKRSHLVMSSPMIVIEEDHEEVEAVVVMPDLLDLNMPAPVDDDDSSNARGTAAAAVDAEFDSWWAGSNLKSEAMVGLIANR